MDQAVEVHEYVGKGHKKGNAVIIVVKIFNDAEIEMRKRFGI